MISQATEPMAPSKSSNIPRLSCQQLVDLTIQLQKITASTRVVNRRAHVRKDCKLPILVARLRPNGLIETLDAVATDVSRSGLKFHSKIAVLVFEPVALFLNTDRLRPICGRVAHYRNTENGFLIGVEFVATLPENRQPPTQP